MTAKDKVLPKVTEKGVLEESIKKLMSPGAIKELGALSPTLQQFLLRFMDYSLMEHDEEHDKILSDTLKKELKEFLRDIHEKDNEEVCRNVAEIVVAQNKRFFKAIDDQTESIKEIQFSMKKIVSSVSDIQSDIREIKRQITDVEGRCAAGRLGARGW